MPIKGTMDTVSLAGILQLLCNENVTGIMRATNDTDEYQIFISEGNIIYATESKKEDRLGIFLRKKKIMTEKQIQSCLAEAKKRKLALGKILVEKKYISEEMLQEVIYKQVEEILFNLFLWEKGDFEYFNTKLNLKWMVVTKLSIMELVLSASRRADEMVALKKQIPSDQLILKITDEARKKKDNKLNSKENLFYHLVIDGSRSVRQLIEKSGYDDFTVYKVLTTLIDKGIVEFRK